MATPEQERPTEWCEFPTSEIGGPIIGRNSEDPKTTYVKVYADNVTAAEEQYADYAKTSLGVKIAAFTVGAAIGLGGGLILGYRFYERMNGFASDDAAADGSIARTNPTATVTVTASPSAKPSRTSSASPLPTESSPSPGPTDITVPAAPLSDAELQACATRTDGLKAIVLDPAGSGQVTKAKDPISGLELTDTADQASVSDNWKISQLVRSALCEAGYTVVSTRTGADDVATLPDKIQVGLDAQPDLAVTIRADHDTAYGKGNFVYAQDVGQYLGGTAAKPVYGCTDQALAERSRQAAQAMITARSAIEATPARLGTIRPSGGARTTTLSGTTRPAQLDACNPGKDNEPVVWLETALGARSGNDSNIQLSQDQINLAAQSIATGVAAAVNG